MRFKIGFAESADGQMNAFELDKSKKNPKKANKTLGFMETSLKYLSLKTHKFDAVNSPFGLDVVAARVVSAVSCPSYFG